jgi:hypothetical protein
MMSSTKLSTPTSRVDAVDRTEMESGLWLFMSAPATFVVTLAIIMYMSRVSF